GSGKKAAKLEGHKRALAEAVASSECKLHTLELGGGEVLHGPSYGSEVVVDQPELSDTQLETAVSWEELPWRRARLMVVGEGRAGKTSLLRSLRGEPFMDTPSTQGLEKSGCLLDRDDVVNSDWSPAGERATEYARAVGAKLCTEPPPMTTAPAQHAAATNAADIDLSAEAPAATDSSAEAPADGPPSHERPEGALRETAAGRGAGRMQRLDKGLVASCMRDGGHQQVVISVWDYAGQELFDALHQVFLSQQGVYLLVFSMSALQADAESVLQRLRFWLDSLRLHARSAPLLLVGTHGDRVQDPEARRELSSVLEARLKPWRGRKNIKAGKNQGLSFFPVDNTLSGGAGAADPEVADLRAQINDMIVGHRWEEKDQRFIDYPVPVPYLQVCDRLCGLQAKLAARAWLQRVNERAQLGQHGEFLEAMSVVRQLTEDPEVPQDAREKLLAAAARHAGLEAQLRAYSNGAVAAAAAAAAGEGAEPRAARHAVATLEEVTQLARECGLGQGRAAGGALTEQVRTMLELFHRLGVVLYFGEIPALQGLVILDPQWLIDVVCAVVRDFDDLHPRPCDDRLTDHPELQDAWQLLKERGLLHSGLLEILWSLEGGVDPAPAGPEERAGLLALLEHFGLLCKLDEPRHGSHGVGCCGRYLVPCLLPEEGEEEEEEAPPLVPGARFDINFPSRFLPQPFFQQLVVRAIQRGRAFGGGSRDPLQGVRRHCAKLSFGDLMELQIVCPVGGRRIHVSVLSEEAGACAATLKEVEVLVEGLDMSLYHGALFYDAALGAPAAQGTPLCSGFAEHILLQQRGAAPEDMPEVSLAALRRSARNGATSKVKRFSDRGKVEAAHFEHWQLRHAVSLGDGEAGDEAGNPASESRGCRGLPGDCRYHFFMAHKFTTGGDQVAVLCAALERAGWKPWYYNYLSETIVTEELIQKGVQRSHCVVLFLSREVFSSQPVLLELREARRCGKHVLLVHEAELDHARVDPDEMQRETPEDLRDLLWGGGLGSIPFQRHRSTGLASLVSSLIRHAGLHPTGTAPQDAARAVPGTPQDASTTAMAALAAAAALPPRAAQPTRDSAINMPVHWDCMVSYTQRDGNAKSVADGLYYSLKDKGYRCWLDVQRDNKGLAAMEEAAKHSRVIVAVVTDGGNSLDDAYFKRPYCLNELRWAVEAGRHIQPVIRVEDKQRIGEFLSGAPQDLKFLGDTDWIDLNRGDKEYWDVGVKKIERIIQRTKIDGPSNGTRAAMAAPATVATAAALTAAAEREKDQERSSRRRRSRSRSQSRSAERHKSRRASRSSPKRSKDKSSHRSRSRSPKRSRRERSRDRHDESRRRRSSRSRSVELRFPRRDHKSKRSRRERSEP
ncbi:hypothetical protein CYMTET_19881, partial [Cymbomonas tetramitiformis]